MNSLNTVTLDASHQQNPPTLLDSSVCVASLPENPRNVCLPFMRRSSELS